MLIINGNAIGADKLNITQAGSSTQPRLLSATPLDFHTVRIVFDSDMLHYLESGGVMRPANYNIYSGVYTLSVLRVDVVSDTTFDLTTDEQLNLHYRLTASSVYNDYGNIIDPLHNTVDFVGIRASATTEDAYIFSGTEAGLDGKYVTGLLEFDFNPPEIRSEDPSAGQKFVPLYYNLVSFTVVDEYTGVMLDTLDAYVDGYRAVKYGVIQSPFDGPDAYLGSVRLGTYDPFITGPQSTWDGYKLVLDYDYFWEDDKQIDVRVIAEDGIGNASDNQWWFRTPEKVPPIFVNQDPAKSESRVSVLEDVIEFDIISTRADIVANSIDAYVDGSLVFSNESFQPPFDGLDAYFGHIVTVEGYDGYKLKLDYTSGPWDSYQTIIMNTRATDAYGFVGVDDWSFRTEDLYPPGYKVTSVMPVPGTLGTNPSTLVQIEIYDTGSGVDPSSIHAWVDGIHAYDGSTGIFATGFDGPQSAVTPEIIDGYNGYKILIDKKTPYKSGSTIVAQIYAEDYEGN